MIDSGLVDSIAYLDNIDRLIESKMKECLNPDTILGMLTIDYQDLDKLLHQQSVQAAQSLFYNTIAAKLNSICYVFEETIFNPYLAHCRKYASLYLISQDRKDTKDSLNDAITIVFSKNADKSLYASVCFDASLKMKDDELKEYKLKPEYVDELVKFSKEMYCFKSSYEEMIEKKAKFEYRKGMAEALAESFKQVLISISNVVKLKLVGSSVMPRVIDNNTINKIRRLHSLSPNLSDDQISKELNIHG